MIDAIFIRECLYKFGHWGSPNLCSQNKSGFVLRFWKKTRFVSRFPGFSAPSYECIDHNPLVSPFYNVLIFHSSAVCVHLWPAILTVYVPSFYWQYLPQVNEGCTNEEWLQSRDNRGEVFHLDNRLRGLLSSDVRMGISCDGALNLYEVSGLKHKGAVFSGLWLSVVLYFPSWMCILSYFTSVLALKALEKHLVLLLSRGSDP